MSKSKTLRKHDTLEVTIPKQHQYPKKYQGKVMTGEIVKINKKSYEVVVQDKGTTLTVLVRKEKVDKGMSKCQKVRKLSR